MFQADQFATRTGRDLVAFITITWALTALGEDNINKRWSDLLNALRHWALRHRIEWAAIGVHENPPPKGNFNSHILCNIPTALHAALTEWLMKQLGGSDGAVYIRPRVCPGEADETLDYMCKGTDPQTARSFRLIKKQGWKRNQGVVDFKRSTISRNINTAAIAAWKRAGEFPDAIKNRVRTDFPTNTRAKDRLLSARSGAAA